MHNELTKKDIEDMEAEIEHRKIVVRKKRSQRASLFNSTIIKPFQLIRRAPSFP